MSLFAVVHLQLCILFVESFFACLSSLSNLSPVPLQKNHITCFINITKHGKPKWVKSNNIHLKALCYFTRLKCQICAAPFLPFVIMNSRSLILFFCYFLQSLLSSATEKHDCVIFAPQCLSLKTIWRITTDTKCFHRGSLQRECTIKQEKQEHWKWLSVTIEIKCSITSKTPKNDKSLHFQFQSLLRGWFIWSISALNIVAKDKTHT